MTGRQAGILQLTEPKEGSGADGVQGDESSADATADTSTDIAADTEAADAAVDTSVREQTGEDAAGVNIS